MVSGIVNLIKRFDFFNVLKYTRYYRKKFHLRGKNVVFYPEFDFKNTTFGRDIYVGNRTVLRNSLIDNNSYVSDDTKVLNTEIGRFCSIGSNVKIGLGIHPTDFVSTHPSFYSNNKPFKFFSDSNYIDEYEDVIIGNDVWIGNGVTIPGGVKINNGAVIAAGAIITKDVEAYSIVGGVPAKQIRYRFPEDIVKKIEASKWWDWPEHIFYKHFKSFHNVNEFMKLIEAKKYDKL